MHDASTVPPRQGRRGPAYGPLPRATTGPVAAARWRRRRAGWPPSGSAGGLGAQDTWHGSLHAQHSWGGGPGGGGRALSPRVGRAACAAVARRSQLAIAPHPGGVPAPCRLSKKSLSRRVNEPSTHDGLAAVGAACHHRTARALPQQDGPGRRPAGALHSPQHLPRRGYRRYRVAANRTADAAADERPAVPEGYPLRLLLST